MKLFNLSVRFLALLFLAGALLLTGAVRPAHAAAGVVGNGTPASCTEAALDEALASQVQKIKFNCGPAVKTITLTNTKTISYATLINGGNKIILQAKNYPHLHYQDLKVYNLKNITLTGGKAENGGALWNEAYLVVTNVKFDNNKAGVYGGAIYNTGTLTIRKSTFTNNRASEAGGAIYNDLGSLTINTSTFTGNAVTKKNTETYGGAVFQESGDVTILGSTFSKNSSQSGSAFANFEGPVTIRRSKFIENKATGGAAIMLGFDGGLIEDSLVDRNTALEVGGIFAYNGGDIVRSTISNNSAGVVGGIGSLEGTLNLYDSTVSGNTAEMAGGMYLLSDFNIIGSTINNNRASDDAGGVVSFGTGFVLNSTLSGNQAGANGKGGAWYQLANSTGFTFVTIANNKAKQGGGIFLATPIDTTKVSNPFRFLRRRNGKPIEQNLAPQDNSTHIQNTILAKNSGGNCRLDEGDISSQGYNLSDDATCETFFTGTKDWNNTPAKLGPLANNGGHTLTHLPQKGSKAIDGGTDIYLYEIDQRGYSRPFKSTSDIGALEVGSSIAE